MIYEYSTGDKRRYAAAQAINEVETEWGKRKHNSTATEMVQMEAALHLGREIFRLNDDDLLVALEAQVDNAAKSGDAISHALFGAAVVAWDVQETLHKAEKEANEENQQNEQEQEQE